MSISTWLTGVAAERRADALVQARVNGAPLGRADLGEVDPALISALDRALLDPDVRRVRAAVEVLGLTGAPEAVAPLVRALGHGDLWLRAAMSRALQQLGAPPAALIPLATHPSATVRAAILPSLARLPDGPAWVDRALGDPAAEVRIAALAQHDRAETAPVEPLLRDPDPQVRAHAADALRRIADRHGVLPGAEVVDAAVVLLAEPGRVGEAAAGLLALVPTERARRALLQAGEQGNLEALRALGRRGGPGAAEVLLRALQLPGCVGVAAEALATLGDPSAISAIEAALARLPVEDDPPDTPSDRSAALKALAALRRAARA